MKRKAVEDKTRKNFKGMDSLLRRENRLVFAVNIPPKKEENQLASSRKSQGGRNRRPIQIFIGYHAAAALGFFLQVESRSPRQPGEKVAINRKKVGLLHFFSR